MFATSSVLSSKKKEFTNDKITAVIFKESFIDKWFNTCSIHFWSIGSSEDIKFTNLKKSAGLYESIIAKLGIGPQEKLYQVDSSFNVAEMLKATIFLTLFSAALLVGSLFGRFFSSPLFIIPLIVVPLLYVVVIVYRAAYYENSKLMFFKDYIYFTKGLFFKEFYYVLYDNIKDITTVHYPFSGLGLIRFNVAGEHIVQQGQNRKSGTLVVSNSFTIRYVKGIETKNELIDLLFYQRPDAQSISRMELDIASYSPEPLLISRPDAANYLAGLIIFSVVLFPLIVLLPITIPLVIWSVRVKSFSIQPYRVVAASGILYRKQISVVFNKIDHINVSQGMFNKMFNNGSITVNTIGSSAAELTVANIPDFKNFHDILKKHY